MKLVKRATKCSGQIAINCRLGAMAGGQDKQDILLRCGERVKILHRQTVTPHGVNTTWHAENNRAKVARNVKLL